MQKPAAGGAVLYGPAGVRHFAGALGTDDWAALGCRRLTALLWPCCTQSSWPVRHAKSIPNDAVVVMAIMVVNALGWHKTAICMNQQGLQ